MWRLSTRCLRGRCAVAAVMTETSSRALRGPLVTGSSFGNEQFATFRSSTPTNKEINVPRSHSLNENNMIAHHMNHEQPPAQWTTFHGKIPVLHNDATTEEREKTKEDTEEWTETDLLYGDAPRTSVLMELTDRGVGVLHDVLRYFWKYDVNICRIESRPVHSSSSGRWGMRQRFDFFVDLEGSCQDENVRQLLNALSGLTDKLLILDEKRVHWFPRHISELDRIANRTLDAGKDLEADHPGFNDAVYRERRGALTEFAKEHVWDQPIPRVVYTDDEISVWTAVWDQMDPLLEKHACKEYLAALKQMKKHCGYSRDRIPQQQDISEYLLRRTNFRMRPVAGLLSSRDFLNGLAFRVFFSTQYIRHHSKPLYTPEPDICHELLGHAPMFADRDFADFSQEIGLASLGASDDDVKRLAHVSSTRGEYYERRFDARPWSNFAMLSVYACNSAIGTPLNLVCAVKTGRTRHTVRGYCHRLENSNTPVAVETDRAIDPKSSLGIQKWRPSKSFRLLHTSLSTSWPSRCRMPNKRCGSIVKTYPDPSLHCTTPRQTWCTLIDPSRGPKVSHCSIE
jgi:phenylalanine-4-hydroxylase